MEKKHTRFLYDSLRMPKKIRQTGHEETLRHSMGRPGRQPAVCFTGGIIGVATHDELWPSEPGKSSSWSPEIFGISSVLWGYVCENDVENIFPPPKLWGWKVEIS